MIRIQLMIILMLLCFVGTAQAAPLSTRFSTNIGSGPVHALAVSGNRLYVGGQSGLSVVDISGSGTPTVLGQISLGAEVTAIYVQGNTVYAGTVNQSGPEFRIVNVSNASSPSVAGSLELGVDVAAIAISGTTAYVGVAAPGGDNPNRGLRIVSVANPSSPSLQGQHGFSA